MRLPKAPTLTPWLRRDQWARFCEVFAGDDPLPPSYDHWLRGSQQALLDMSRAGFHVRRVEIDVEALVAWCDKRNRVVDPLSMMLYSSAVARQRDNAGTPEESQPGDVVFTEKTFSPAGASGPKFTVHFAEEPN